MIFSRLNLQISKWITKIHKSIHSIWKHGLDEASDNGNLTTRFVVLVRKFADIDKIMPSRRSASAYTYQSPCHPANYDDRGTRENWI